jgi:two-component system, sensor histidine kinase and response regulator
MALQPWLGWVHLFNTHMKLRTLFIRSCIFFVFTGKSLAQTDIRDSLRTQLRTQQFSATELAQLYGDLAYYTFSTNIEVAGRYADTALYWAKKSGSGTEICYAHYNKAQYHNLNHEYVAAIQELLKAKKKAIETNNFTQLGNIYEGIGEVFTALNVHNRALYFYVRALNISIQETDSLGVAYSNHSIGNAYRDLQKYDSSLLYLNKALYYFLEKEDYLEQLGMIYLDLGKTYYRKQKRDSSQYYLNLSRQSLSSYQMLAEMQEAALFTGYNYLLQNNTNDASPWLREALHHANQQNDSLRLANSWVSMGDLLYQKKNLDSAYWYYTKAFYAYKSLKKRTRMMSSYHSMLSVAIQQKNYPLADSLSRASWANTTSNTDETVIDEIENLLASEDALAYKVENNLLKERNQLYGRQQLIITIAAILLAALLIYVLFLYQQRKKSLQKQQNSNLQLQKLDTVKTKVLSIISHDLRAPLTSTYNLLDLYNTGLVTQDEFDIFAEQLQNDVRNSLHLTDNLLHWAKSQLAGIQTEKKEYSISMLTDNVLTATAPQAQAKNIGLAINLNEAQVFTDEVILNIILRNLLSNAIKFSRPDSTITIEGKLEKKKYWITITDSGVGMNSKQLDQINSQQATTTTGTGNEKGAGIGLRLVYELIQLLSEQISYYSQPGNGTIVKFSIQPTANPLAYPSPNT